ncbi:DUF3987 domain-containing protein [Acinetobacter wanghuae]|uniref:DUF3987 domain-containing protein n=1 Tax=Acinetobacter wanghuae TaxID=2662362 RepID=UPI003AF8EE0D
MTAYQEAPSLYQPSDILKHCTELLHLEQAHIEHKLIQRFGSPEQPIYVDESNVDINGVTYEQPLIMPIYDGQLELVQCAVMQDGKRVSVMPDGLAKGFAMYGDFHHDKPVIITYSLEAFFKVAQAGYAVALVVLPTLCNANLTELNPFDFEQIQFVINQLSAAGYTKLYLPVRPEKIKTEPFKKLEQHTAVKLLNQYLKIGVSEFYYQLVKDEDTAEIQAFIEEAIEYLLKKPQKKTQWQQPIPLSQVNNAKPTPFPIGSLPLVARQASEAIAERVQAPIAMAAMCVLGTLSHIAQAQVNAPKINDIHGLGEPCSLFLITEGGSGSRKSSCKEFSDKAILEYERQQYEVFKATHEQWKDRLLQTAKKDREAFTAENPEPPNPKTLFNDITFESLAGLYIDGVVANVSINTDEAAQFFGGHSMKSETANSVLGGFTKLFDDGFVQRQRAKSNENGSGQAYDIRLTFNLQGQHEILSKELKDPIKREQGFLPRFLFAAPESLAGHRTQDEAFRLHSMGLMNDPRLTAYWGRCKDLIAKADTPNVIQDGEKAAPTRVLLRLSREANQYDLVFYNECEQLQLDGKEYETIKPFASRAAQLARRVATVLAFFEQQHEISKQIMSAACDIVRYSLKEWLRYADIEPKKESNAEKLLKWLVKQKDKSILYSKVQGYAPNPMRNNKQILDQVLQELEDFNYIRMTELGRKKYIEINPNL